MKNNENNLYFEIFSKNGISVSAINEKEIDDMSRNPKILHVTAASYYKTHSSNETMKFLNKFFYNRLKSDQEIWLYGHEIQGHDMPESNKV